MAVINLCGRLVALAGFTAVGLVGSAVGFLVPFIHRSDLATLGALVSELAALRGLYRNILVQCN